MQRLSSHVDNCFGQKLRGYYKLILRIRNKFVIRKEEAQAFKYLGFNISQKKTEICIHQKEYVAQIECIRVDTLIQKT